MSEKIIMLLLAYKNQCGSLNILEKHKKFIGFNGIKKA